MTDVAVRFRQWCGDDQFPKFVDAPQTTSRRRGALVYWQEALFRTPDGSPPVAGLTLDSSSQHGALLVAGVARVRRPRLRRNWTWREAPALGWRRLSQVHRGVWANSLGA